jgi:hypothetical protein
MIKAYLKGEQTDWDLNLGCLAAAYRATPQASTGLTPNMLMLGRQFRISAELMMLGSRARGLEGEFNSYGEYAEWLRERIRKAHAIARDHLQAAAQRQRECYDAKMSLTQYKPGDLVWYLNERRVEGVCPKLQASYEGPYLVVKRYNDQDYRIQMDSQGKQRVTHHDKLKPYRGENPPKWVKKGKCPVVPEDTCPDPLTC